MIVDTSALIAVLYGEAEAKQFAAIVLEADICRLSVANYLELSMVTEKQLGPEGTRTLRISFSRRAFRLSPSIWIRVR